MEDGGLVEVSEVGHVLTLLKLGRVHLGTKQGNISGDSSQISETQICRYLLDLLSLEHFLIMTDGYLDLSPVLSLQQTLHKPAISIRDPVGLLGIVSLGHVGSLHLEGEEEVGGGVGVLAVRGPFLLVSGHPGGVESVCHSAGLN